MTKQNRPSLEELMFAFAKSISRRATCSRLRVGAVIASLDMKHVLAYGYNGNVAGGLNACDEVSEGGCGCIHAELNALLKLHALEPCRMFTTTAPCLMCAKCIVNSNVIQKVDYLYVYRDPAGLNLLVERGLAKR